MHPTGAFDPQCGQVEQLKALPQPLVFFCHAGIRSAQCAAYLASQGIDEVFNLRGGIHAWAQDIDPDVGFDGWIAGWQKPCPWHWASFCAPSGACYK